MRAAFRVATRDGRQLRFAFGEYSCRSTTARRPSTTLNDGSSRTRLLVLAHLALASPSFAPPSLAPPQNRPAQCTHLPEKLGPGMAACAWGAAGSPPKGDGILEPGKYRKFKTAGCFFHGGSADGGTAAQSDLRPIELTH